MYDDLKNNVLDSVKHADELHVAIRLASNPEHRPEHWQIVMDPHTKVAGLQAVHKIIPMSKFNQEFIEISVEHPDVVVLGDTYDTKPYKIGMKRISDEGKDMYADFVRTVYKKENHAVILAETFKDDPQKLHEATCAMQMMPDDDYQKTIVEPIVQQALLDYCREIPEQEARKALDDFYLMTNKEEISIKNNDIAEQRTIEPFRKLKL